MCVFFAAVECVEQFKRSTAVLVFSLCVGGRRGGGRWGKKAFCLFVSGKKKGTGRREKNDAFFLSFDYCEVGTRHTEVALVSKIVYFCVSISEKKSKSECER